MILLFWNLFTTLSIDWSITFVLRRTPKEPPIINKKAIIATAPPSFDPEVIPSYIKLVKPRF